MRLDCRDMKKMQTKWKRSGGDQLKGREEGRLKQGCREHFTEQPASQKRAGSGMSMRIFKPEQNGNCFTILVGLRKCTERRYKEKILCVPPLRVSNTFYHNSLLISVFDILFLLWWTARVTSCPIWSGT